MRLCLTVALALTGCGDESLIGALEISVPWQGAINPCIDHATIGANLVAVLEIGGHDPCPLSVNPTTLAVSGSCPNITTRCFRPLALGYFMHDPASVAPDAELGYLIGWVDLRREALQPDQSSVTVVLTPDGTNGELISTDAQLAALPDPTGPDRCADPGPRGLTDALFWAKELLTDPNRPPADFDRDASAPENLQEACDGTLFP